MTAELFSSAVSLHRAGHLDEAASLYRRILLDEPGHPVLLNHLGIIAQQTGQPDRAVALIGAALRRQPNSVEVLSNLGIAFYDQGKPDDALICFQRALAVMPGSAESLTNVARILKERGRLDEAIATYRQALAHQPDHPEIHTNLGAALLLRGDFAEGWAEHEWRLRDARPQGRQIHPGPIWTGDDPAGRTILLHGEQGYGDTLQFVRYASLVAERGATVILQVYRPLVRLLRSMPGIHDIVAIGDPLPPFDLHCPLMSLPSLFDTRLESVPASVPYLAAEPQTVTHWAGRLAPLPGPRIGLVWAGDPRPDDPGAHAIDRQRSLPLSVLTPLLAMAGVSWVSLQRGDATRQRETLPATLRPFDAMGEIGDFADTAALVANLDLVITVDTAVAHLAGALGKPVWILSRFNGCWRWLLDRDDTPWYPSARLFRQESPGDWSDVVRRVGDALSGLTTPDPTDLLSTAIAAHRDGRAADAMSLYCRILARTPDNPFVLHHLGLLAQQEGDITEACRLISAAIAQRPDYEEAYNNLGIAQAAAGEQDDAAASYARAIALSPAYAKARNNLGQIRQDQGRSHEAISLYKDALTVDPAFALAHNNLGAALIEHGRTDKALPCLRRATNLDPALALAHNNLGTALLERRDLGGAAACYRTALALRPDDGEAQANLGMTLLTLGEFDEGWRYYEGRNLPAAPDFPRWRGEDLDGRSLLLQGEQGLGDVLQFSRFASLLAERGATVMLQADPVLRRLLATVPGITAVISADEPAPFCDFHLPLMSAPFLLRTRLASIPASIPYLSADPGLIAHWGARLSRLRGLKLGLAWAGNPRPDIPSAQRFDRRRSLPLAQLRPLLSVPGVRVVSLQKNEAAKEIAGLPPELRPLDLMGDVADFADTAALISSLDLVITVDSAVAHLAGALGKPVWILSRFDGCWRWLTERDDSPWYPSARLFRQKEPGGWNDVIHRVAASVTDQVAR